MPQTRIEFSYQAFERLVRRFAETAPRLLLQRPETAELALAIERLRLIESLRARFTVAIVGQMRVGKSTLLNALIGRRLAPTGITETTATINWFRHARGELTGKFRVHWNDGSSEDLPLQAVAGWLGQEEHARATRALDFFADSEFLRSANLVDTPGTRSVIEQHEQSTQGFLADRLEATTLRYGGRADAVIYAINPVAREADRDLLRLFGERTRLPGASAYNSIAVVQKWEHLEPDPLAEVEEKCQRLRQQLAGRVAEVIATSGLLAEACREQPAAAWEQIAELAVRSTEDALEELLLSADDFRDDIPGAALGASARQALYDGIPWPVLRFSLRLAHSRGLGDGGRLQQAVGEASGIERLTGLLRQRFFSLAGLIKASTVLRKAWDPCNVALLRLRDSADQRRGVLAQGRTAAQSLARAQPAGADSAPVLAYVKTTLEANQRELKQVESVRRELHTLKNTAAEQFHFLDSDIACLEQLETLAGAGSISTAEQAELYRLFGGAGPDAGARLGLPPGTEVGAEQEDSIWDRHEHWAQRKARAAGQLLEVCEHALRCLDRILDRLESENS